MFEPFVVPAVNHVLRANTWALERLAPFAHRIVRFETAPFTLSFLIRENGEIASAPIGAEPDATIRLTPGVMLRVLSRDETAWKEVEVTGDTDIATAVNQVWRNLQWDFEEDLAKVFGDIPAHRMAETGRALQRWGRESADNLARSLAEYWTEEQPLIAGRNDIESFIAEVDRLRDDVARLEKRFEQLSSSPHS